MTDQIIGLEKETDQSFDSDPTETRDTGHCTEEYVWGFVDKWDELIDWEQRVEGEGDFFIQHLLQYLKNDHILLS